MRSHYKYFFDIIIIISIFLMLATNSNFFPKQQYFLTKNIFVSYFLKRIINFGEKYHYICAKISLKISFFWPKISYLSSLLHIKNHIFPY